MGETSKKRNLAAGCRIEKSTVEVHGSSTCLRRRGVSRLGIKLPQLARWDSLSSYVPKWTNLGVDLGQYGLWGRRGGPSDRRGGFRCEFSLFSLGSFCIRILFLSSTGSREEKRNRLRTLILYFMICPGRHMVATIAYIYYWLYV